MDYAIECTGLSKSYPDFTLGPIDLRVERGTIVGLVGPNGVGKTTLIKLLLGLTVPNAGAISVLGMTLPHPENMPDSLKAHIGVVLDACAFAQTMRMKDVAQLGRAAYKSWDDALFEQYAKDFELDASKDVSKLSRGMGMKLSIAFALAHHPELLILDEATAGLDPIARDEILDILRDFMLDESHAILMSSHITSDLEKIADKIICLDDGLVLFAEYKEAICDEAGIAHVRDAQLDEVIAACAMTDSPLHSLRREYGIDVLVPDRFAFAQAFPEIPVDKASIDEYLNLVLKGDCHAGHAQD